MAEAGQPGAVTIATNMAGRGVDIKLGGNPEHLARQQLAREDVSPDEDPEEFERRLQAIIPELDQKVAENRELVMAAGGLFICGTERHESRRIDNQLRGRAGRQGDPGESRFFLSAEDDLVRLFAGDRIYKILDRLGGVDEEGNEEPIEAGMLSKQIEKAQKKVEEQNFLIRKRVLEYDDVMNEQRRVIYAYRDEVLEGKSIGEEARQEVANVIDRTVEQYTEGDFIEDWDLGGLSTALDQFFPVDLGPEGLARENVDRQRLSEDIVEMALERYNEREAGPRRGADGSARALPAPSDHRRTLARAPVRHGLSARGDPPSRLRPDRSARRLQERGLHALRRSHEQCLGGLRPHDLQRAGQRRGRERAGISGSVRSRRREARRAPGACPTRAARAPPAPAP